jgi:hypothetical protein
MTNRPAYTPTGTSVRVERIVRAHYPDGRVEDSNPFDPATLGGKLATAFGRMHLLSGTRLECLERTITTTATDWAPVVNEAAAAS